MAPRWVRRFRPWCVLAGWVVLVGGVLVGGVAASRGALSRDAQAQADGRCTAATVTGRYGYSASGTIYLGVDGSRRVGGTPAWLAAVGMLTFDGQGRIGGAVTVSVGGAV